MKAQSTIVLLLLCLTWILFWNCVNSTDTAGNISQTGNGMVAGILFEPDGKTPSQAATVYIRKKNTLADTSLLLNSDILLKRVVASSDTVLTDNKGKFVIDSIDTGTYVIEAVKGNNRALIDPVTITSPEIKINLTPDTLMPAGAIKGVITLSEGGDPRKILVLAFGIDRFTPVSDDGSFVFGNLAQASYKIRILSTLDNYGVIDTAGIQVISADTTILDTIRLPFTGIPTVKNLTLLYDTSKQVVTISWDRLDTSLLSGYKVYRKNTDPDSTVKNPVFINLITDTLYRDSTALQDHTYMYQVTTLDKHGNEGLLGTGVSVKVIRAFTFINSFGSAGSNDGQFEEPGEMATDSSGNIYILDPFNSQGKIHKFTPDGVLIKTWIAGEFGGIRDIEIIKDTLYVLDRKDKSIQIFNTSGELLRTWPIFSGSDPIYFSIKDNYAFIIDKMNQNVLKYSIQGDSLSGWSGVNGNNFKALKAITADSINLFILDCDSCGYVMDFSGNLISQFKIDNRAVFSAFSQWFLLKSGELIYAGVDRHAIFVIDLNGRLVVQFGVLGVMDGQFNFPISVTESSYGIYISDAQNRRIQIFRKR